MAVRLQCICRHQNIFHFRPNSLGLRLLIPRFCASKTPELRSVSSGACSRLTAMANSSYQMHAAAPAPWSWCVLSFVSANYRFSDISVSHADSIWRRSKLWRRLQLHTWHESSGSSSAIPAAPEKDPCARGRSDLNPDFRLADTSNMQNGITG